MTTTTPIPARARGVSKSDWLSPARLLIVAALFHVALTIAVYGIGRYALLPGTFDGYGVAFSAVPDSTVQRADAAVLSELLRRGELLRWLDAYYPIHIKLYSVCFAIFGPWLGLGIISVEPLNVLCYLAMLILVFKLGREIFDRRVGLLASLAVALWPSLLLHSTQLIKDTLFVVAMLAFVFIMARWLTREFTWTTALLTGSAGGLIAAVLWLARDNMGEILIVAVLLGAGLLVVRQLMERRARATSLVGMALMLATTIAVTQFLPKFRQQDNDVGDFASSALRKALRPVIVKEGLPVARATSATSPPWSRLAARIGTARRKFITSYPDAGSNIDSDVQIIDMADLAAYLPRAAAIGFFAPFPNMWFGAGRKLGSTAKLLSGVETLALYAIEALALFGLWRGRRRLPVWLLFSVATTALVALGLVVINIGTLFRLRYAFVILVIIIGAEGAAHILGNFSGQRAEARR